MIKKEVKLSKDIDVIQKEVPPIIVVVDKFLIKTHDDMVDATEILSKLNIYNDMLIEDKEKITAPLNQALKGIRDKYRPTETMLSSAITTLKTKMGQYQLLVIAEQKKAEDALKKGDISLEEASNKVAISKTQSSSGAVSFRNVPILVIKDKAKIPKKYLVPDEVLILADLKAGKKVAGCELGEKVTVVNNRK